MNASPIIVQANSRMTLTDGTRLATDIYRPAQDEPIATLLLRTPYGKASHLAEGLSWAKRGFAFVVQDVRGRYDSEGAWQPYVHERADGREVVSWLAAQSWSTQRLVLTGGSYGAFTAWAGALSKHPAIRAALIQVPAMGSYAVNIGNNGILQLSNHTWWWMTYADGRTTRAGLYEKMLQYKPEMLHCLPVVELSRYLWADLPGWSSLVSVSSEKIALPAYTITDEELAHLSLPVLHIGGWHDPFIEQTLHQWQVVGSALSQRPQQTLIVGPWSHELRFYQPASYGERSYGKNSQLPLGQLQLQWLHHLFQKAEPTPPGEDVTLFVTGSNQWIKGDAYPLLQTYPATWHAHDDGTLRLRAAQNEGRQCFLYDPLDPFPSRSMPVDRHDLIERQDAIRYLTPPFTEPLTYIGSPIVKLSAMSDAPDTDWVARLHEVLPDGRMLYLGHSIIQARQALAADGLSYQAKSPYTYTLCLRPLAITLPVGHRLCLEITSSDFPQHARNLNTGRDRYTTSETRIATQTIFSGPDMPTTLILPQISPEGVLL